MVGGPGGADMTTFSLHPVKAITTGEGGLVSTESDELAARLRLFRTHGITKDGVTPSATDGDWYYEMQALGFNYRITDFQCALGLSQLERLDEFVARRNRVAERYRELLGRRAASRAPARGVGRRPACLPPVRRQRARWRRAFGSRSSTRSARRASASRFTTSRSIGTRTTGTSSDLRRTSARGRGVLRRSDLAAHVPRAERHRRRSGRGGAAEGAAVTTPSSRPFLSAIEIGGRRVGPGQPAYVIAEAGANHNRDLGLAKALIDAAADAGADAVKFQTYTGAGLYSAKTPRFEYLQRRPEPARAARRDRASARVAGGARRARALAADRVLLDAVRPRRGRRSRRARRPRDEDRVVRDRRSAADRERRRGRSTGDPLDRHGDVRRDRGRDWARSGRQATTRSPCCAAHRSIRLRPRS